MRLAFVGNGSLGDPGAQVRDGTVADRRELFGALERAGVEVVYVAPRERSPGDDRVVGNEWRGEVDALVLETRDAVWPPAVACLEPGRGGADCDLEHGGWDGYGRCVDAALTRASGIPVYVQAKVLRDWSRGEFGGGDGTGGLRPPVLLWDFDLNVRRVVGAWGRGSTYELGAFWRRATPWMGEVLEEVRRDPATTALVPYRLEWTTWAGKRPALRAAFLPWAYPAWLEVEASDVPPLAERRWDLAYTGSDYDRRRRWWHFYVEGGLARGARVAVTGTWGDRRGGREKAPWNRKGFRSELEGRVARLREAGAECELSFLSPASTVQLPFMDAMRALSDARVSVQVVPDEYARIGYRTNRWQEIWARGTLGFIDEEIRGAEEQVAPEVRGSLVTGSPDRIERAWTLARAGDPALEAWYRDVALPGMRRHLRETQGAGVVAERLLGIVEEARSCRRG